MSNPVQLYCWHFMAYPHLPADFDQKYDTGWVTVPNSLWDKEKSRGLYQQYIDQLAYSDELGFDGMVLNEHHQNIYGLMPSPNLIAAALTQRTKHGKIVILGNLLPLHLSPLRVAEEYAMLDNMSDGRLIAGFAPGSGPETFNYDVPSAGTRAQFWEAVDFIHRAWTEAGPFTHEGRHYPMRYVNPWPQPTQPPHPPIWIPGSRSRDTLVEIAKRGYCYFLSSRSHGKETARSQQLFSKIFGRARRLLPALAHGHPDVGLCRETDAQAQAEAKEGVWYFLKNCLKGHLRREGRQLTFGPGIPYIPPEEFRTFLQFSDPTAPLLGDAESCRRSASNRPRSSWAAPTRSRRIMEILAHAQVGNLLIQFHLGNMADTLTRKSMRLFATDVAPRLRAESARLFAREFPNGAAARAGDGEVSVRTVDVHGRKVPSPKPATACHSSICMASRTCTASPAISCRSTRLSRQSPRDRACASRLRRYDELDVLPIEDVVFHYLELFDARGSRASIWSAIAPAAGSRPSWRCGILSAYHGLL